MISRKKKGLHMVSHRVGKIIRYCPLKLQMVHKKNCKGCSRREICIQEELTVDIADKKIQ